MEHVNYNAPWGQKTARSRGGASSLPSLKRSSAGEVRPQEKDNASQFVETFVPVQILDDEVPQQVDFGGPSEACASARREGAGDGDRSDPEFVR